MRRGLEGIATGVFAGKEDVLGLVSFASLLNGAKSSKEYFLPEMDKTSANLGRSGFLKL